MAARAQLLDEIALPSDAVLAFGDVPICLYEVTTLLVRHRPHPPSPPAAPPAFYSEWGCTEIALRTAASKCVAAASASAREA
jgi:hypothetical protein